MKKKMVLAVELYDEKLKRKVMQSLSRLVGVDEITVNVKDKKLTVVGDFDPVCIACKVKKLCPTEILSVSVGPAKEPEKKKEEPEIEESVAEKPKKEEPKKDEKKKDVVAELTKFYQDQAYNPYKIHQYQELKKEEPKKDEKKKDVVAEPTKLYQYQAYNPYMQHYCNPYMQHYYVRSVEEDHNGCVIC